MCEAKGGNIKKWDFQKCLYPNSLNKIMNIPIKEILRFLIEHKIIKSWHRANDNDKQYFIEFF